MSIDRRGTGPDSVQGMSGRFLSSACGDKAVFADKESAVMVATLDPVEPKVIETAGGNSHEVGANFVKVALADPKYAGPGPDKKWPRNLQNTFPDGAASVAMEFMTAFAYFECLRDALKKKAGLVGNPGERTEVWFY